MIQGVSPSELLGWLGIPIGGTVIAILVIFLAENTNLVEQQKRMQSGFAKKNADEDESKEQNDNDENDLIPFNELTKLITKKLFERHLATSMYYLMVDLLICVFCQTLYHNTIHKLDNSLQSMVCWPIILAFDIAFIWLCGTCELGLWVAAHECGHHAFSDHLMLNDFIGFTLHSYLLAPYFSWQYSHSVHHSRNRHIDMDETHNPKIILPNQKIKQNRFWIRKIFALTFGWYVYLGIGFSGAKVNRAGQKIRIHSHFYQSDLFPREYPSWKIYISNVGMLITLAGIYYYAQTYGWWEAFRKFIGPRLVTNYWLIFITTIQHSHKTKTKYLDDSKWSWYKGAIRTIDYDYGGKRSLLLRITGRVFDFISLSITSTHVCHHLFSKMPHYNCVRATPIIKKALGRHYKQPDSSATASFFRVYNWAYPKNSNGEYDYAG